MTTRKGSNRANNLYWKLDPYVWNNDGDTAKLRKKDGSLVDPCSYSGSGLWKAGKGGRGSQAAKRELKAAYEDCMSHHAADVK